MTPVALQWKAADSREAFVAAVADDVRTTIEAAVRTRGRALIALSGGKTPIPVLERLAALPLPWQAVTVIPSDDRIVPIAHALSNAGMLTRILARTGAQVLPLVGEVAERVEAGQRADTLLRRIGWPLDLVWLGMGTDGHTASIFPGPDLAAALTAAEGVRAVGVHPEPLPPEAPVDRVTLTAAAIAEAQRCIVVIEGETKRQVLQQAAQEAAGSAYPIGPVLAARPDAAVVHWLA